MERKKIKKIKKYYYAVRNGRKNGIYESWDLCQKQVIGYPNAIYKKFSTKQEAESFVLGVCQNAEDNILEAPQNSDQMIAFVDGSFNNATHEFGWGAVCLTWDEKWTAKGKGMDPDEAHHRNVAGELYGAMYAMDEAIKRKKNTLYLYHDYTGIAHWATGDWKCNHPLTKKYQMIAKERMQMLDIVFVKVKAHSNHPLNDEADSLAKQAVNIKA